MSFRHLVLEFIELDDKYHRSGLDPEERDRYYHLLDKLKEELEKREFHRMRI